MKKTIKDELIEYLIESCKTNEEIKKHCESIIRKKQHELMLNPKIYIVKVKVNNTDREYLNARLFLPIGIDKTKELRTYIGPIGDFPNGIKDTTAIKIGMESMRKRIKNFIEENN